MNPTRLLDSRYTKFIHSFVLLLLLSAVGAAQDIASKADELVNAYTHLNKFSGVVLVAKGGKVILSKGYGMANYELDVPNTPQTKFRLGSITKQFTALAVMQLQEKGLLNVDDPITKYLPDYPKTGEKVTVYHLITHTSGIPSFTSFPDYQATMSLPTPSDKTIAKFKDKPLEFTPGEKYTYSNSAYFLLGHLIEKVSGKSYEQYLKEHIFQPLGMNNTGYDHNNVLLKNRAAGYAPTAKGIENASFIHMSIPGGAGALYSTVEDLYLWDRALYTDKLVKKESLEKIFTPFKSNYGYGWVISQQFGRKRVSHGGGINGFSTNITRYINDDVCIIALSNFIPSAVNPITRDLAAVVFGEKYELPKERVAIKVDPKIYDAYLGEYELAPGVIVSITREGDKLMAQAPQQPKLEVFPESETKFFVKEIDAQITFVKNDKGEVTHAILHQGGRDTNAKKIK